MSFNQDEYNLLISDKRTVMSFSNNDSRNGRIIVMDAIIRPHSFLLNEKKTGIINPHRSMSNIPVEQIRACPRCGSGWHPVLHSWKTTADEYTTYTCETKCGVSICGDTYMRFVSNQRVAKVDIPTTAGDSMARATEAITLDIGNITLDVGDITIDLGGLDSAQDEPTIVNTDVLDIGNITIHHSPTDTKQKEA